MRDLIAPSAPLASAAKVRLHGVDNYTDTFPLEKAMDPTTLVVLPNERADVAASARLSRPRDCSG